MQNVDPTVEFETCGRPQYTPRNIFFIQKMFWTRCLWIWGILVVELVENCFDMNLILKIMSLNLEYFNAILRPRKKCLSECKIIITHNVHEGCTTWIMTNVGNTEKINTEVGQHQWAAFSPLYLFVISLDTTNEEINE